MGWGADIQPRELKRECHSCGRSEHLDALNLCATCRKAYDDESAAWELVQRQDDDAAARQAFYGA